MDMYSADIGKIAGKTVELERTGKVKGRDGRPEEGSITVGRSGETNGQVWRPRPGNRRGGEHRKRAGAVHPDPVDEQSTGCPDSQAADGEHHIFDARA